MMTKRERCTEISVLQVLGIYGERGLAEAINKCLNDLDDKDEEIKQLKADLEVEDPIIIKQDMQIAAKNERIEELGAGHAGTA